MEPESSVGKGGADFLAKIGLDAMKKLVNGNDDEKWHEWKKCAKKNLNVKIFLARGSTKIRQKDRRKKTYYQEKISFPMN